MTSLLLIASFLSLIPILLIFARKMYLQEPFNFLAILCLLCFLKDLPANTGTLSSPIQPLIEKVFSLLLFGLLAIIFLTALPKGLRYGLSVVGVALLSMAITWWSVKGWEITNPITGLLLNGALILL